MKQLDLSPELRDAISALIQTNLDCIGVIEKQMSMLKLTNRNVLDEMVRITGLDEYNEHARQNGLPLVSANRSKTANHHLTDEQRCDILKRLLPVIKSLNNYPETVTPEDDSPLTALSAGVIELHEGRASLDDDEDLRTFDLPMRQMGI